MTIKEKIQAINREWKAYKFKEGQYFDKVFYRLLNKYSISLNDFYDNK